MTIFAIGSRVKTTAAVEVKKSWNGKVLGTQPLGSEGTIAGGPAGPPHEGPSWDVIFDTLVDGWVAQAQLALVATEPPIEPPVEPPVEPPIEPPVEPPLPPVEGVLIAPQVPQPLVTGDLVGFIALSDTAQYVTFGQVFAVSALMPGESVIAVSADGTHALAQVDVKTLHPDDGSVAHAIVTVHGSGPMMLAKGTAEAPATSSGSEAAVVLIDGEEITAIGGTVENWLEGPLVNEVIVNKTALNGQLKIQFCIRAYADGTNSTDVVFDNGWMFEPGKTDLAYTAQIVSDGFVVYDSGSVSHKLYNMWHYRVGEQPNIQFDVPYLLAHACLPDYDLATGVSGDAVQYNVDHLGPRTPFSTGTVQPYMPMTGGRPDIGPQPNWVAQWLVSQDAVARYVMMANADAAGGIPWHYIDEATGQTVTRETVPDFMPPHYGTPANGWAEYGQPWTPDGAHMPDLNYVPYLITGDWYQLRLLQSQAGYAISEHNPYYAYYDMGQMDPLNPPPPPAIYAGLAIGQTRHIAWSIRQVAEAAFITPDNDPLRAYFVSQLVLTMQGMVQHYISNNAHARFGTIRGFIEGVERTGANNALIVGPWQQNYVVTALALAARTGIPGASGEAVEVLRYMVPFVAGLYTNSPDYHPYNASAYWLYVNDPVVTPLTNYDDWAEFHAQNVENYTKNTSGYGLAEANPASFPEDAKDLSSGYSILARCGLAMMADLTGLPQAIEARDYVNEQINLKWVGQEANQLVGWQQNPVWHVRVS